MNLKYYLRGLGIGIIVTAILMGVATNSGEQMTDAEIRERAVALGMVEQKVLADIAGETDTLQSEPAQAEPTVPPEIMDKFVDGEVAKESGDEASKTDSGAGTVQEAPKTDSGTDTVPESAGETPKADASEEVTKEPDETRGENNTITLTISSGESSESVSRSLAEYGLVEDASEFDRYLSREGYDKSICVGEFEITQGATHEEIARIITKGK